MTTAVPASWFVRQILSWYDQHGRHDLPWKLPVCPYRIWVSEIMLQQTQVATVIDYFNRFMKRFPTLVSLAKASEDDVLAHWAGLGYYARARNLHKAAQQLIAHHNGIFPRTVDGLQTLPGIGPSTAAAIVAQAFDQRATILDGNVKRILSRFFCVAGAINQTETLNTLWDYADRLTPKNRVADYTQAIMDIGATLCTKSKPACSTCPVQRKCQAFATGQQLQFPVPKASTPKPSRKITFLCLHYQDKLLFEKRPASGIWGGLYSLLEFADPSFLKNWCESLTLTFSPQHYQRVGPSLHTFTHFQLEYETYFLNCSKKPNFKKTQQFQWVPIKELSTIGLPAPIRKVVSKYIAQ